MWIKKDDFWQQVHKTNETDASPKRKDKNELLLVKFRSELAEMSKEALKRSRILLEEIKQDIQKLIGEA